MKFFNVKTAIAAVCVVAAGMGGFKAYNAANLSETDMLLAENVEALSSGDNDNTGGISDCMGSPVYNEVGVSSGKATAITHVDDSTDEKCNITYKYCYAYGYGELSGMNGYIDYQVTSAGNQKCKGNHSFFPF